MSSWKWSTGELYYKSARPEKKKEVFEYDTKQTAINQSLDDSLFNQDEDLLNITNSIFSRNANQSITRREDLDTKIADRQMVAQRGINPFLGQTSYVNDIVTRDMFLKPINTTQGKTKENSSEETSQ